MNRAGFTAAATAAFLAAVSVSGDAWAQRSRLSLSERVAQLERQMAQRGDAPTQAGTADQELVADLLNRVQLLTDEVQSLTALVEQQGNEIESLKRRQRQQFLDLDERVNRLQGSGSAAIVTPPTGGPVSSGGGPTTRPTTPSPRPPATNVAADSREAYENAFSLVKANKYGEAITAFSGFLERHGGSDYADNAQYWLGESYYASGNYPLALEAFQALVQRFPNSSKLADARLKIGFTHYGLEQWDEAEKALNGVIESYPGSTAARLAENRLRVMRLQGRIR